MTVVAAWVDGDRAPFFAFALGSLPVQRELILPRDVVEAGQGLPSEAESVDRLFQHTPKTLVESWRFAQAVLHETRPGDTLVVSDLHGLGGILALMESGRAPQERRTVWTLVGDGSAVRTFVDVGTYDHLEGEDRSSIDWQLVQMRFSDRVLVGGEVAAHMVEASGGRAELINADAVEHEAHPGSVGSVYVPGPVSRSNRSGEVLRGLAGNDALVVTVGPVDVSDKVWTGTTWDTLGGPRRSFGERLTRGDAPSHADLVVFGDPLAVPGPEARDLVTSGARVLAPAGSLAARLWREPFLWRTPDDIAAVVQGRTVDIAPIPRADVPRRLEDGKRARSISVGIPVYSNIEFLDACVESVLAQSQPPAEVVLLDDGSASTEVDAALQRWSEREPDLVRTMRQPNRGVCVARNTMISSFRGDAFLLVDQDDVLDERFLELTSIALRQDSSLWGVATWTEFIGAYEAIEGKPPFDKRTGLPENTIISTAALLDRRVWEEGIRFEPDLAFLFCEDWHVWAQITALGGRLGLVPEPLVKHRVHHASGGFRRTDLATSIGRARATAPLRDV